MSNPVQLAHTTAPLPLAGQKQWDQDRRTWQADRLAAAVEQAGYPPASVSLVRDMLFGKDVPDPRDIRRYDVTGPLGSIDFRTLEVAAIVQVGSGGAWRVGWGWGAEV
jgi:hypothetical protein